ncbi:MAG TPA: hypothetical protein VFS10_04735 [Pyrinomonadaceae bacterium]|nr:hypothetical protein [Pyrinomonadaceae bacterium]
MKVVFAKSLVVLAGVVLVVPFVTVALLVAARAAEGAESTEHRLLLAALAVGGALYSGAKSLARKETEARGESVLRLRSRAGEAVGHAFMKSHG